MISIIIPIYNAEKFLNKCLDSVCKQSYKDIEVILIDDGSKDNSSSIARKFANVDKRIKFISQSNQGVSSARNKGLDLVEGDYVLFVDADDWIELDTVEILVNHMESYNVDIVCFQNDYVMNNFSDGEIWDKNKIVEEFLIHKDLRGSLGNKLFKKEFIGNSRLDETIKYGEDALFLWEIILKISSMLIISDILYHITFHEDSSTGSGNYKVIRKDCVKVWKKIADDAESISPKIGSMARAQLGNMAFFSLYEMGYYNYKNEEHQKTYLMVLKNTLSDFCKANFISLSKKLLALIFLINIHIGMVMVLLKSKTKKRWTK